MNVSSNEFWDSYTHDSSPNQYNNFHVNPQPQQQAGYPCSLNNHSVSAQSSQVNDCSEGLLLTTENLSSHLIQQQQQRSQHLGTTSNGNQVVLDMDDCEEMENVIKETLQEPLATPLSQSVKPLKNTATSSSPVSVSNMSTGSNGNTQGQPMPQLTEDELYERRKAQNRAAQRAFRERKEGRLKELSAKLSTSEKEREKLLQSLEELKKQNMKLGMENQILQKTTDNNSHASSEYGNGHTNGFGSTNGNFTFPKNKEDFVFSIVNTESHFKGQTKQTVSIPEARSYEVNNEEVLNISAVWDYLNDWNKSLQEEDDTQLDIVGVMNDLRGKERCHGFGPAYPMELVNQIVQKHINRET